MVTAQASRSLAMPADDTPEGLLRQARAGDGAALGCLLVRYSEYLTLLARLQIGRRLQTAHSTHQIHTAYLQGTRPLAPHAGGQLDLTEA